MKKLWILTSLAIAGLVGCNQNTSDNTFLTTTMTEPAQRFGGIPEMQAVMLSFEESFPAPGNASLRSSTCADKYVLQIKRNSNYAVQFPLRVISKDADNEGYSAVYNTIPYHTIPTDTFATFLLYDEDNNEICFDSTDNIAFLQPNYFGENIEFVVRLYNVSSNSATNAETIEWLQAERYYFTMYPLASTCDNQNPDFCCEYYFTANAVGSIIGGTMRYRSIWDNDWINLVVPPMDDAFYTSDLCGAIGVSWDADDHLNTQGIGTVNFECDDIPYQWQISDGGDYHGVIFDPNGRLCYLTY